MKPYDYLVVGSGLYGSVFAYKALQAQKRVLVLEKREHIGGNIYCTDIDGIHVHTYGAHIFHTSNKEMWNFVNKFVEFNRYTNCPVANYKGKLFNLPFNMNTFYQLWGVKTPAEAMAVIAKQREESGIKSPTNLEEQAISLVGKDIYEILIKDYTEKQWGRKCSELPAFIIQRLPVRFTFDNNYFNDSYQGIPIGGYNKLIQGLLDGIEVRTQVDFFENRQYWESIAETVVFTGKIDEFYNYCFGKLDYRTVRFETEVLECQNYQGNAVVNYTSHQEPYTRIIEHKHFEPDNKECLEQETTIITREYPADWKVGDEPYYPVNDSKNSALYSKYKELASKEKKVVFGGRLGMYRYFDMDDTIAAAWNLLKTFNL